MEDVFRVATSTTNYLQPSEAAANKVAQMRFQKLRALLRTRRGCASNRCEHVYLPKGSPAEITPDFSDDHSTSQRPVQASWLARASYANAKGQGHKHGSLYNIRDESSINAATQWQRREHGAYRLLQIGLPNGQPLSTPRGHCEGRLGTLRDDLSWEVYRPVGGAALQGWVSEARARACLYT